MVLSCIYNALRITGQSIRDSRVVITGAGAAAHGIANLIALAVREEGGSLQDAQKKIWMVDSKGLVTKSRSNLEQFKTIYAREVDEIATYNCKDQSMISLEETIENSKPAILIGTSATPGIFGETVVRAMAKINERPIIFPLSNPTSKSECTPEQAIRWSDGRAIVATGSPFPSVEYGGRRHEIGLCNNAFIFPGFGLGVMVGRIRRVTDNMFLAAAKALSGMSGAGASEQFAISPELRSIRECSHAVACAVIKQAVSEGHADEEILTNLEATVKDAMWFPEYLPIRYEE